MEIIIIIIIEDDLVGTA